MLAIRLQRLGRKALPVYRLAVQEARRHPSSGRIVAYVGSYNPHTKAISLDKEKVDFYLGNGAQPSPRVIRILQSEKVKLPAWVKSPSANMNRQTRHPEKLRKNQPQDETSADTEPTEAAPADTDTSTEQTPEEKA